MRQERRIEKLEDAKSSVTPFIILIHLSNKVNMKNVFLQPLPNYFCLERYLPSHFLAVLPQ